MNEKDKGFSKLPHLIIDSGILAEMNRQDVKVYLVIKRHADYATAIAFPSAKKICELAGINKNDLRRTVDRLQDMGLIVTAEERKGLYLRKYYGVVSKGSINPELALSAIPKKPGRSRRSIVRAENGRFRAVPKNTDNGIPQTTEDVIPQNTDEHVPQNGEAITGKHGKEESNIRETDKRDRYKENPSVFSGTAPATASIPVNKVKEMVAKIGFFETMKKMQDSPDE